jgi:hypothetical protein
VGVLIEYYAAGKKFQVPLSQLQKI